MCSNRGKRLPSVLAIDPTELQEIHEITYVRDLHDSSIESPPPVIWSDGIFNYKDEIWTDSLGKEITDETWENSTWLRKAFHISFYQFMIETRGNRTMNICVQCSNVRSCSANIRTREHGFEKKK